LRKRLNFLLAIGFVLLLSVFSVVAAAYQDKVYAVVEDEVITLFDVKRQTSQMEKQIRQKYSGEKRRAYIKRLREQVARNMLHTHLCYAEFENRGLTVPENYLEDRIDAIVNKRAGGDYQKFEKMLNSQKMRMEEIRKRVKKQLASQLLLDQFVEKQSAVTPEEVEAYFKKHKKEFKSAPAFKLAVIFLKKNKRQKPSLSKRIDTVKEALTSGKSFSSLARKYSDDSSSAEKGGLLGWVNKKSCRQDFLKAVKALKPPEVSDPINTADGVYFLQLKAEKEGSAAELTTELRDKIRAELRQKRRSKYYKELIERLKKKFYVKTYY